MPENVFPTPTPLPPSWFLLLCLFLPRTCPVPLQELACPPGLLPGSDLARVSGKKKTKPKNPLHSVYKSGQRWVATIHRPPLGAGVALLWQVSLAVKAGSFSVPDPRYHLLGNFKDGPLSFPSVLPSDL